VIRVIADHIYSPLGNNSLENYKSVLIGKSGIQKIEDDALWREVFFGSIYSDEQKQFLKTKFTNKALSFLEGAMIHSIEEALKSAEIKLDNPRTLLILTTTKGNVDLLQTEKSSPNQSLLNSLNYNISNYFGLQKPAMLISNACVSGLLGIVVAARLIEGGFYDRVVICGGDLVTRFTLSGFQSFMAVSPEACKPFDVHRSGISLGEGVATIVLAKSSDSDFAAYVNGASANDANHISGPSRNGEGLYLAVKRTLEKGALMPDMISAHGTATPFNDEMECQAFNRCALNQVPLHSLKGNYGHTLGAAGLIETIVAIHALKENKILPTLGFTEHGVTLPLKINKSVENADLHYLLKTSSGFGGCNTAALFSKT
jgi:3-oxoacyl-[acyl-carrier-protein] synthase-1